MIGTRPEAIKLSPVAHALAARGLRPSLIVTGQHEGLDPAGFGLGEFPAVNLRLAGEADPHLHVRKVAVAEEAAALGVPLLVLREKTERPEGLVTGNMRLVGTSTEAIVAETQRILSDPLAQAAMSLRAFPYGDGHAAGRIAEIVDQWLARGIAEMPEPLARRGSAFHTGPEC